MFRDEFDSDLFMRKDYVHLNENIAMAAAEKALIAEGCVSPVLFLQKEALVDIQMRPDDQDYVYKFLFARFGMMVVNLRKSRSEHGMLDQLREGVINFAGRRIPFRVVWSGSVAEDVQLLAA